MGISTRAPLRRNFHVFVKWTGARYFAGSRIENTDEERKPNMLTTETRQFARVLADKLAELTNQRPGRDRIAIETSPDEVEECLSPRRETLP